MKIVGASVNVLIVLAVITYLLYLGYNDNIIPDMFNDLFNNILFRASILVMIVMVCIGHDKSGLGGPMTGIMLAIAYIITMDLIRDDKEMFLLDDREFFDENYSDDEDIEEPYEDRELFSLSDAASVDDDDADVSNQEMINYAHDS